MPPPSRPQRERAAGIIVFGVRQGQRLYLLLRHREGGHWSFPKGRLSPGETPEEAARRETREETGLAEPDIELQRGFVGRLRYRFPRGGEVVDKEVLYFLGRVRTTSDTPDLVVRLTAEHTEYAWLPYPQARERLGFKNAQALLDRAEAFLALALGGEGVSG